MMTSSSQRALAFSCAALLLVIASGGCQILGCEPRRCQLNDVIGACAEGQVCGSDGFCRDVDELLPCGEPPASVERDVSLRIVTTLGVEAMGNELFDVPASFVVDVRGCTVEGGRPRCPASAPVPALAAVVQPLGALSAPGAEAFAPLFDGTSVNVSLPAGAAIDVEDAFTVEVLFRTPTNDEDSVVVAQQDLNGAWGVFMNDDGVPVFIAGDRAVLLGNASPATWHHVLCHVDAAAITSGVTAGTSAEERDETEILCITDGSAVSGTIAGPELVGQLFPDGATPLTLGESDALGDPALVVVRVWNGNVLAAAGLDDFAFVDGEDGPGSGAHFDDVLRTTRVDVFAAEARARLARYVGLRVTFDGDEAVLASSNLDVGVPRAQPIAHGGFQRHEYVGGGWPRVSHTTQGLAGVLLEPLRADLLEGDWAACPDESRTTLAGRNDACDRADLTLSRDVFVPSQGINVDTGQPIDAALVFTVFADLAGGAPEFVIDDVTVCSGLIEDAACVVDVIDDDDTSHTKMTYRFTSPAPRTLNVKLRSNGVIWSPQLELGIDPSAPMNGLGVVFTDQIIVRTPLAAGTSTSLRATVASDGSSIIMSPVQVLDGGARYGRVAALITFAIADDEGDEQLFFGGIADVDGVQEVVGPENAEPFPFLGGAPVRGGLDLGEPVDACTGCTVAAVPMSLDGQQSFHTTFFQGLLEPGFLIDADVLSRGLEPHPLPLDIGARPPANGCLEHRLADVSLVACDDNEAGVCSENARIVWAGEASLTNGPSLGERAAEGSFETSLPSQAVDDDTALLFEVRFERPDSDESARLFVLDDNDNDDGEDGTVLTVAAQGSDALITVGDVESRFEDAWPDANHWNQLTCLAGASLRCTVNAGVPVVVDSDAQLIRAPVVARVGSTTGPATRIAFARAWFLPGLSGDDDVIAATRLMDARVAATFGLGSTKRAGPYTLVETRAVPAVLEQQVTGATFDVGAHWPRVIEDEDTGVPVYVADVGTGEGLVITGADLASVLGVDVSLLFAGVGVGRVFTLAYDPPEPPDATPIASVDSLVIELVDSDVNDNSVRLIIDTPSDNDPAREPITTRPILFDGKSLSVSARLFNAIVSSQQRVTFGVDTPAMDGGDQITLGGGVPLRLRLLRVAPK